MQPREEAVSSVVGTTLMLSITVAVFGAFSLAVVDHFSEENRPLRADLAAARSDTGAYILEHRGGTPIPLDEGRIVVLVDGSPVELDLTAFASQVADGETWRIGESLCLSGPQSPPFGCLYPATSAVEDATVIVGGAIAFIDQTTAPPCVVDGAAPTADLEQAPADVATTTTGSILVTLTATDACSDVDDAADPTFHYRLNDGSNPAWVGPATMADGPGDTWTATIPDLTWGTAGGLTLEYYAAGLADDAGNVLAQTSITQDAVQSISVTTYAASATPTAGSVLLFNAVQADDGTEATLQEQGTTVGSGPAGPAKHSGGSVAGTGLTNPSDGLASDDVRVSFNLAGDALEVGGFDLPAYANAITDISFGFEGRRVSGGGTSSNAIARIDYKVGAGSYSNGPTISVGATSDTDFTRSVTADRAWTIADAESATVRIALATHNGKDLEVDHAFATLTYTTTPGTTYTLQVRMDFPPVPVGSTQVLGLEYRVSGGDTFDVQVWDGSTWTAKGTLSATSAAQWTSPLTASEYNAGAPRIRFVDTNPAGASQGFLHLDYVRVVTN